MSIVITTSEELVDLTATSETTVEISVTEEPITLTVAEGPIAWGTLVGTLADQADLAAAMAARRVPMLIVAASDASVEERALADYRCDGVNDEEQIEDALIAASSGGGGIVRLTRGTFNQAATIHLQDNTILAGAGMGVTIITASDLPQDLPDLGYTTETQIRSVTKTNVSVRDLTLECSGGTTHFVGLSFDDASVNCYATRIECVGHRHVCLRAIPGGKNIWFIKNYCHDTFNSGDGILVDSFITSAGDSIENVYILGNRIENCAAASGQAGIGVWSTSITKNVVISNNIVTGTKAGDGPGSGIRLQHQSSSAVTTNLIISNNIISDSAAWGIQAHPTVGTITGIFIANNVASNNTSGNYDLANLGSDAITSPNIGQTNPAYALSSDLTTHAADTTAVHGIVDTSALATTDYVNEAVAGAGGGGVWGAITGTLSDQADLQTALNAKQDALGYIPVNKAGDSMSGNLDLGNHTLTTMAIRHEDSSGINRFNLASNGHINAGQAAAIVFDNTINVPAIVVNNFLNLTSPAGNTSVFTNTSNGGLTFTFKTTSSGNYFEFVGNGKFLARLEEQGDGGQLMIGGSADPVGVLDVLINAATRLGQRIRGAAAQSADLQQWQNSSGTPLSRVDASGRFVLATISGTPSGTPSVGTTVLDTSTNKLWVYTASGWKSTSLI